MTSLVPGWICEAAVNPFVRTSASTGTPYRLDKICAVSPCATTIGDPPCAVQPEALPAPCGGASDAVLGTCCEVGLAFATGAASGRASTGEDGTEAATLPAAGWLPGPVELRKGFDKGSLSLSELEHPASIPAAAPVKARRNAKPGRNRKTNLLM